MKMFTSYWLKSGLLQKYSNVIVSDNLSLKVFCNSFPSLGMNNADVLTGLKCLDVMMKKRTKQVYQTAFFSYSRLKKTMADQWTVPGQIGTWTSDSSSWSHFKLEHM